MKVQKSLTVKLDVNAAWLATGCVPAFDIVLRYDHPLMLDYASTYNRENQKHIQKDGGVFHYGITESGFVHFSYTPGPGEMKTGHGGDWSSNPMALKELTGIEAVEVTFRTKDDCGTVGHIVLSELMKYVPSWLTPVVDQIGAIRFIQNGPIPETTAICWASQHRNIVSGIVNDHIRCSCGSWCWMEP